MHPRIAQTIAVASALGAAGLTHAQQTRGIIPVPHPELELTVDFSSVSPGMRFTVEASVENTGPGAATSPMVRIQAPPGFTLVGSDEIDLGSIGAGTTEVATFVLEAPCPVGPAFVPLQAFNGAVMHDDGAWAFLPNITTLAPEVPYGSDDPERLFRFNVTQDRWALVASEPSAFDRNLEYAISECGVPLTTSDLPGDARDFVVANGHQFHGERFVRLTDGRPGDPYTIRHADAKAMPVVCAEHLLTAFQVGEIFEVDLFAGERYEFSVAPESPFADLAIFHFGSNRVFGARDNATAGSNSAGPGGEESIIFYAQHTGTHAFIVTNENHVTTDVNVCFFPLCICQFDGEGGITILDLLDFLSAWFTSDPAADANADGSTDIIDLLEFLDCWFNASPTSC